MLLRRDTARDAELLVLRHENAVLRRHLAGPVRHEPEDRFWLAALSSLIPRHRWRAVFPFTPGTLLAWHRRLIAAKWDYSTQRTRTGRPPTRAVVKNLVTAHPTRYWAVQQARNTAADLGRRTESLRFLLRDRDDKYGQAFDAVFEAEEMEILKSAPQVPRMNAHCERVIGSIRREALDHVLIMNEAHARRVLAAHQRHCDEHRPHRAHEQTTAVDDLEGRRLLRTRVLGGVINEYRYAA